MGYTMHTGGPHDRNTRQCRKTPQQTFPVCFLGSEAPFCYEDLGLRSANEDWGLRMPARTRKPEAAGFMA